MKKIILIVALFLFLGLVTLGGVVWWGYTAIFSPVKNTEEEVVIQVGEGETLVKIADDLKKNGLIRAPKLFSWYAGFSGKDKNIVPGTYSLFLNMNVPKILDALNEGKTKDIWFTIPEGWTAKQIASKLESQGIVKQDEFLSEVNSGKFDYDFLKDKPESANLEGYLFPDTYKVEVGKDAHYIIGKMLQNFDKRVNADLRAEVAKQGKNLHDIIIMASIVEKEAASNTDRKMVAGVFYNRLAADYPLASCATLQYIKGTSNRYLSAEETLEDSPWNTYMYKGLPPGPIGNPGLESIKAAIYPTESDYYFFLSDSKGKTYFAETQAEQDENRAKYIGD